MLVERRLRFFLEEGVDALVQVVAGHEVVNDAEAVAEEGALLAIDHAVGDLGQLTLLLDDLDRLAPGSTL